MFRESEKEVCRIVFCRLGGIGDVMHTLPLVKYMRKKFPQASIEYITSGETTKLLNQYCPYIDSIWEFNKKEKKRFFKVFFNNKQKVSYFLNLHNSFTFFLLNLFHFRARRFFQYKKDLKFHAVINFAQTYDPNISAFMLDSKTLIENKDNEILNKYKLNEGKYLCFVVGVGKSRVHRAWSFSNWLSLTKKILFSNPDYKIVFLGGDDEVKMFQNWSSDETIDEYFKGKVINLIGKLSLPETANVISKSYLLASCDTGLLHIAAAFSKKAIGLYGPTLPKRTGPYSGSYEAMVAKDCKCSNSFFETKKCKMTRLPTGFCMDSLNVDNVLSAITLDNVNGYLTEKSDSEIISHSAKLKLQ